MSKGSIYDVINYANLPTELFIDDKVEMPFKQDDTGYVMNPKISRKIWNELGDKLSLNEKNCPAKVTGDKYITLRLDGKGFSNVTKRLRKMGIFSKGFSFEFADIMTTVTTKLCDKFGSVIWAFTQSDEITLVINKSSIVNGKQISHEYDGRRDKLITHAAGLATMIFNRELVQLNLKNSETVGQPQLDSYPDVFFDCRMAQYDTLKDAFELILWRAYDCSVNGVSSAVYMSGLPECKKESRKHTDAKLLFLYQNGCLPMPSHQAYGSLWKKIKLPTEVMNPLTKSTEIKDKWQLNKVNGHVIVNVKNKVIEFE